MAPTLCRGISHERLKDWDRAERDFRKALELNPEQPQVLNYLGYSLVEKRQKLDEALAMIDEIRGRALLGPLRGRPGADLGALADLLVILAALGARGDIAEMDLNPVRAGPAGATVLDAVILRAPTEIEGKARQ